MFDFLKQLFGGQPAPDFDALRQAGAVVVDVRTADEFRGGSVPGALNIPVQAIGQAASLDKLRKLGKPIITCCASGMRSRAAANILKNAGLEAYNGGSWGNLA